MSVAVVNGRSNDVDSIQRSRPATAAGRLTPVASKSRPSTAPAPVNTRSSLLRQSLSSGVSSIKQHRRQRTLVLTTQQSMDEPVAATETSDEPRKRKKHALTVKKRSVSVEGRFKIDTTYHPLYYIDGGNGISIVERTLKSLGWRRSPDKYSSSIKLYWCDFRAQIDFNHFAEGDQMVNHIPNNELIANKLGLLTSLREYERVSTFVTKRNLKLHLNDFHPETFFLDDPSEFDDFCASFRDGDLFICKPVGLNQGIGIYLIRNLNEFKRKWTEDKQKEQEERNNRGARNLAVSSAGGKKEKEKLRAGNSSAAHRRIAQRYIMNPLLLDGRKFDIRCYVLIACTTPYLVLFHSGYLRLSLYAYETGDDRNQVHLTNQYVQKKDPLYESVKADTVWSMERFNKYFNENLAASRGVERDWVLDVLPRRIRDIVSHVFMSVRSKLAARLGYFELFGLDFMIDDSLRVWLIEVNTNPSLDVNVDTLADVIPPIVDEGVRIALEAFDRAKRKQPLLPLPSLNTFDVVFYSGKPQPPFNTRQSVASSDSNTNGNGNGSQPQSRPSNNSPPFNASRVRAMSKSTVELTSATASAPRKDAAVRRSLAPNSRERSLNRTRSVGREANESDNEKEKDRPADSSPSKPTAKQTATVKAVNVNRGGSAAFRQRMMTNAINRLQDLETKQSHRNQAKLTELTVSSVRASRGN